MIKILIVEDNMCNFILLKEILIRFNFYIFHAENGKDFYEIIENEKDFNLVLMDIGLPDTTGIILSQFIIDNKLNIPIIICSAYNDKSEEINNLGIECFVHKPIKQSFLISCMKKYIDFP